MYFLGAVVQGVARARGLHSKEYKTTNTSTNVTQCVLGPNDVGIQRHDTVVRFVIHVEFVRKLSYWRVVFVSTELDVWLNPVDYEAVPSHRRL